MIRCPRCGANNANDSLFCAECGNPLQYQPQTKKSGSKTVIAVLAGILCTVFIVAGVVFVLFITKQDKKDTEEVMETEAAKEQTKQDTEQWEDLAKEEDMLQDDTVGKGDTVGANADVNAVETAFFEINGVVSVMDKQTYLKLEKPVSVYAYNDKKEAVYLENVSSFLLQEEADIGDYNGSGVSIKGSVSIGEKDQPILRMTQYTVTQQEEEDTETHRYQFVLKDCTWEEAARDCVSMGGYLAQINSYEEYITVVGQIEKEETYHGVHFYLGGRRDEEESDYYWVDSENQMIGNPINDSNSWAKDVWMEGEPSFVDGEIQEMYMNLFYYEKELAWVLNDVPEDVSVYYPGKTGFICELED